MNTYSEDDLTEMYDKVSDALVIAMTRRCIAQLSRRRLVTGDDAIQLLEILSTAIDNAIAADDFVQRMREASRGGEL